MLQRRLVGHHVLGLAPRHKHVVGQVNDVVPHPLVGINKRLDMPPGAIDRIRLSASTHINEKDLEIHRFVCVAMRFYVPICRPAITDNCSAGLHISISYMHSKMEGAAMTQHQSRRVQ
jgi:hypothetical protein